MKCMVHTEKDASGVCSSCGQHYCEDCLVNLDGSVLCKGCADRAYQETRAAAQQAEMNNNQTYGNPNYGNPNYNNPGYGNQGYGNPNVPGGYVHRNRLVALLLCIFLGCFGAHRFYAGKIGTGILYLFTFGLFGIGYLVDLIMIATGSFLDNNRMPLIW